MSAAAPTPPDEPLPSDLDDVMIALGELERTLSNGFASLENSLGKALGDLQDTLRDLHAEPQDEFKAADDRREAEFKREIEQLEAESREPSTDDPLFEQVHEINRRLWAIVWVLVIGLAVHLVWR
jgi:hypothetical protein